MIRLTRIRREAVIHENFRGERKRSFEKELLVNQRRLLRGEIEGHTFNSDRWKPAKEQLLTETLGKCAYCEAPMSTVAYGDVEYYRPKSVYWWLAYCIDNYLASCQLCNQKFKKAFFPIKNRKMREPVIRRDTTDAFIDSKAGTIAPHPLDSNQVDKFIQYHKQERPLLLNPYFDDPTEYVAWRVDDVLGEVEFIAAPSNTDAEPFVMAAIEYYGLNRRELLDHRHRTYKLYRQFKRTLNEPRIREETKNEIRQTIESMQARNAPFAGMIRYFEEQP